MKYEASGGGSFTSSATATRLFLHIPVVIATAFSVSANKFQERGVSVHLVTEPVQPYMIEPKMNDLLTVNEKRKEQMHTIERIARFHLEFEGIHPFIDGNGRTGRLILNLDLIRNGFPPINVKFTDRKRYYDAFDTYYRDNDASEMINLIAEYVDMRLDEYFAVLS